MGRNAFLAVTRNTPYVRFVKLPREDHENDKRYDMKLVDIH